MKIQMTKKGMTRWCQDYEKDLLTAAGWSCDIQEAKDESPKPTAKSKGAAKETPDNAIQQGDE